MASTEVVDVNVDVMVKTGVLTVSDSCHQGKAEDKSGTLLRDLINGGSVLQNAKVVNYEIVPDEQDKIKASLLTMCDDDKLDIIFTTGGTGFAPRDVTPESTKAVLHKEAPGLSLAMLKGSLTVTPLAMLSRSVCGIRGTTLIINLPGSRKAVRECVGFIQPALGHAVDLLRCKEATVKSTHMKLQGQTASEPDLRNHAYDEIEPSQRDVHPAPCSSHPLSAQNPPSIEQMHSYSRLFPSRAVRGRTATTVTVGRAVLERKVPRRLPVSLLSGTVAMPEAFPTSGLQEHSLRSEQLEPCLQTAYSLMEGSRQQMLVESVSPAAGRHTRGADGETFSPRLVPRPVLTVGRTSGSIINAAVGVESCKDTYSQLSVETHMQLKQHQQQPLQQQLQEQQQLHQQEQQQLQHRQEQQQLHQQEQQPLRHQQEQQTLQQQVHQQEHQPLQHQLHQQEQQPLEQQHQPLEQQHQPLQQPLQHQPLHQQEQEQLQHNEQQEQTLQQNQQLSVVEVVEIENEDSIELFTSAPDQSDSPNELLSSLQEPEEGSATGEQHQGALADCMAINATHLGLTEDHIVDDVSSLSDFVSFPEDPSTVHIASHGVLSTDLALQCKRDPRHSQCSGWKVGKQAVTMSNHPEQGILPAKMHRKQRKDNEKIYTVPVGNGLKQFLATHLLVKGLYLNRGKRDIKRNLVSLQRNNEAVDMGSWQRGDRCHARNRLDDHFVPTVEGRTRVSLIEEKRIRDEYVVNWYLWCPGHGNCQRKCGGYGECVPGCKGMAHKQDRHNCSILLNMKLFLSDVKHWKVYITGHHVIPYGPVTWTPPLPAKQRLDEDMRDLIVAHADRANTSDIVKILSKRGKTKAPEKSTKKRVSYFVSSMKKRRKERDYNYADTVRQSRAEDGTRPVMHRVRLAGPGADVVPVDGGAGRGLQPVNLPAASHPPGTLTGASTAVTPSCPGSDVMLTGDQSVVLLQSDDPGTGLLSLGEIMDVTGNVIEIQTTADEPADNQQSLSGEGEANESKDVNSHLSARSRVVRVVRRGPCPGPTTSLHGVFTSPAPGPISGKLSRREDVVVSAMAFQDVTHLNVLIPAEDKQI